MRSFLDMLEMERYIAASAKRADLKVEWHDNDVAATTGKTIYLPRIKASITEEDYMKLVHYVTHEVDHVLHTDFTLMEKNGVTAETSLLGAIWNCLEDHRVEWLGDKEFEGDRQCNDAVEASMMAKLAKKMKGVDAPEKQRIFPMLRWEKEIKAEFHPSLYTTLDDISANVNAEGQSYLDKMVKGNYADVLRNVRDIADPVKGSAATYKLAKRLFKEVYELDPEKEEERCKQEAAKGKGKGKGEGEGKSKVEAGDGKADASEGDGDEDGKGNYAEYMETLHVGKEGNPQQDLTLSYVKYKGGGTYTPATKNDYTEHDLTTSTSSSSARSSSIQAALSRTSAAFAHRVRALLQIRNRSRYQYGTKKGKLHGSALHRITVPNAPGYSDHIFKRKIETNILDAAVTLLVDQSGSMSGMKYDHAAAAAVMMSETIGNVLHVPVEILSFTSFGHGANGEMVHMYTHRKFNDKLVQRDVLVSRFAKASHDMSENPDGDAIMFAFDRLTKRKEPRKILIVFSDGSPAGGCRGDICYYTKKVVKGIEEQSPVEIIGVGILDRSVKHYYKDHFVIEHADRLETELLKLIEHKLVS